MLISIFTVPSHVWLELTANPVLKFEVDATDGFWLDLESSVPLAHSTGELHHE
jgi:hypothetical protein